MLLVNEEHKTFLSGRTPPKFDEDNLDHPILVDWYKEQLYRCKYGYEHKGYFITGTHYFMLNFVPIKKLIIDNKGNPTKNFEIEYPLWSQADDKIFKQIDEARDSNLDFMLMTSRSFGKTYISIALCLREYVLFKKSHCIIAGTSLDAVKGTFNQKLIPSLNELEARHLILKQKRLVDTEKEVKSGEQIDTGTKKETKGRDCVLERIIFTKEGATAGRRAKVNLFEEIGEWDKNPKLADCINNNLGISKVGGIKQGFNMYIGTGGSIASDQARDIFFNPRAYELYIPQDCDKIKYPKGHGVFMPAYTKYGGCYEATGYTDEERAKKEINTLRESKADSIEALNMLKQQYPLTLEEMFMKNSINVFTSLDLADQTVRLQTKMITPEIDIGDLHLRTNPDTGTKFVEFQHNPHGRIKILKHPDKIKYKNLYCMGVDSIDIGNNESADKTGYRRSKLACLVKQRINPDASISDKFNNSYVAMYLNRADDVEDDYEQVMLLSMYYDCKVMLEFTKTTIKSYFKRYKQDWRFCKSPDISSSRMEGSDSIGFRATEQIIRHYIGLIKEYIKENSYSIFFQELCEQLIDYTYEEKGKFDLIAAMGGCEIHDEQLSINFQSAKAEKNNTTNQSIGYYYEQINGRRVKRYGIQNKEPLNIKPILQTSAIVDYVDTKNNEIVYKK
jgi:hypothetical protein